MVVFRKSDAELLRSALRMLQIQLQRQSGIFTDREALTDPAVFEAWAAGMKYGEGQIIRHGGGLYRVAQGVESSVASQPPDADGMLAVYRPIVPGSTGGLGDPIAYVYGMDCTNGKYYSYEKKLYLCKADMLPCVWPPGTAGLWQWEEVGA